MKLYRFDAKHTLTGKDVSFLVTSKSQDRAGWPLLRDIKGLDKVFLPTTLQVICDAPNETERFVGYFGPPELDPLVALSDAGTTSQTSYT